MAFLHYQIKCDTVGLNNSAANQVEKIKTTLLLKNPYCSACVTHYTELVMDYSCVGGHQEGFVVAHKNVILRT